jgi:hypothetical protein
MFLRERSRARREKIQQVFKSNNRLPAQRFGEMMSTVDMQRVLLNFCTPIDG